MTEEKVKRFVECEGFTLNISKKDGWQLEVSKDGELLWEAHNLKTKLYAYQFAQTFIKGWLVGKGKVKNALPWYENSTEEEERGRFKNYDKAITFYEKEIDNINQ